MSSQNPLFQEEAEEIPDEMTEEMAQANLEIHFQIKRMIDSFNIEELSKFIKDNHILDKIYKSEQLLEHLMKKIDENFKQIIVEIERNPMYDCSQILDFFGQFFDIKQLLLFQDEFSFQEHLFKIIELTDNLLIYEKAFYIFYIFPENDLFNYFPRLIYLEKILYEHINYLSPKKINLIDYYKEDPKYENNRMDFRTPLQFDIEYNEPTSLEESYENICKNRNHNKIQQYQFQNKKVQIVEDDQISALTLSRNLLNKHNEPFSPLIEILKYKILIKRGLQKNPQITKNIIIKLHLQASKMLLDQRIEFKNLEESQTFYNSIIGDVSNNEDYFNLFKLETIDPLLVIKLLQTFQINNKFLDLNNQFQKLLSDVLSMKKIEQNEYTQGYPLKYYPELLSENLVKNEQLTYEIFQFFLKNQFIRSQLSQDDYNEIINIMIRSLNIQDNRMMLQPVQLEIAVKLLSDLIRNHDPLINNQNLDVFVQIIYFYINQVFSLQKPTQNGYVQINETDADIIMNAFIDALNYFINIPFMFEQNQLNNDNLEMIHQISTKIQNSNILGYLANKLQQPQQFTKTISQTLQLISSLLNSNFQLIDQILNSNLPDTLNQIILNMKIEEINSEIIMPIISFYANITRREEINKFNNYGIRFLDRLINYQLITKDNQSISFDLHKCVNQYNSLNDRSKVQIHEILLRVLRQLLEQLNYQQQTLNFNQDFESQFNNIQKKKRQIILFNSQLCNFGNQSLCKYLHQNGYFEMFANLFKIPSFNNFISIRGFNSAKCIERALQLINEWERELGCTLEKATFLSFNQKVFLENCSIQTYQIASRFSEILDYLSQIVEENNLFIVQQFPAQLIDKCCALLEILLVNESENKNAQTLLFRILNLASISSNQNINNLQPVSRLLNRLIFESNNNPAMALKLLKIINNCFQLFGDFGQITANILINSEFGNHLQDLIQNYIQLINTDNSNTQLINELEDSIYQILVQLYTIPKRRTNLSIISKIISDLNSLIKITRNSTQERIKEIQKFLLVQANYCASPEILQYFEQFNIPQNSLNEQLINQLEQMGYKRQLIINVLRGNPEILNVDQFKDFVTQNQERFETESIQIQQNDELIIQQVKAQQEQMRLLLKENIDLFSNSDIFLSELHFFLHQSEILSILQLSALKQFNLSLQFQGIEIEIIYIILALNLLYKQQQQQQQQLDSITTELLKLLDVLLQQHDQLRIKAVNFTLAVLSNQITDNLGSLILKGVQKTLDSSIQNDVTFSICIDVIVKVFIKNRSFINQFIQQMRGLESVFKVKGDFYDHFKSFSQLTLAIIYDKIIIRAQIEAYIKKVIFDQENVVEIKNQKLNLQHYQNENVYPICLQPVQYNIQNKEQYKILKNHPALQILKNNQNYLQEDIKYVMNLLFDESVENDCLILRNGIRLDTLDSIKNGNAILQFDFKHKKETQILLKLLVEQIIISYFDKNEEKCYKWKIIFDVLQLLISQFPLLLPQISRINCSQFLEKYKNKIGYENSQLPPKISFLTLITRFIIPPKNFLFCICLDTLVLFKKSNNIIVPFAYEIRRLIIKQLYVDISKSINSLDENILSKSDILVDLLQIKSVAKICILNIKEPQNSYNFIKLYIEGIKNININNYFIYRDQLFFMIKTLNLLYNVATNLLLEETEPINTYSLQDNQMELRIIGQINPRELNDQVFQSDQTYQQNYQNKNYQDDQFQYYIQNWPFLQIKNGQFQENTYQNMELEIPIDRLQTIPEINNSQDICTKELEEELNYWTDEFEQIIEEVPQNNLEIDNSFNHFINGAQNQTLKKEIYKTDTSTILSLPQQFQINLLQFKLRLPTQNTKNHYETQNFMNFLCSRQEIMHRLLNFNKNLIQDMDQNFGKFQSQNINNNRYNGMDDNEEIEDIDSQIEYEMDLANNQLINHDIQIENQAQLNQQQQQQQNIQPIHTQGSTQTQKIKNIVNSALKNRKQTLKHLGKIDQQLVQCFLKIFFYVDDDFGSKNDYINAFLISLGTKGNCSNQIIQAVIRTLNATIQNQRQENVDQQIIIIQRNEVKKDFDYSKNFVQKKALNLLIQFQETSKFNISEENVKELIELLYKLKGNSFKQLLQFLVNQEQKYHLRLAPDQVSKLYNLMIEQKDTQISTNCMNLISNLWNIRKNMLYFIGHMKNQIIRISKCYNNSEFINQLQFDQAFNQLHEVEKIFYIIQIAFRLGEQEHEQCLEFLNSYQIQTLFNILQELISQIQNLYDCQYNSRLLPILKAFLICHQTVHQIRTLNLPILKISSIEISQTESGGKFIDFEKLFKKFCKNGGVYINHIIKDQINNMLRSRMHILKVNDQFFEKDFIEGILNFDSQVIDFQNKKNYLYTKLQINNLNLQQDQRKRISVRRSQIFEDSYIQIRRKNSVNILRQNLFYIHFDRESAQDAGGLTVNWIMELSKSILDQKYQLFIPNSNKTCYLINRESSIDPDHLRKFRFVGRIFALAILFKVNIDSKFPIYFFKHIVGQKLSRSDIQYYDEEIYTTLNTIYNQKIDSSWNLYWSYTIKKDGVVVDEELKPGGKDIEVTEDNKKDFVRKYCHQIMAKDIENQIKAIQEGFYSLIPKEDIKIFDSIQLELLLCGQSYIYVEDLIQNLFYNGCTAQDQVIGWLQNTLRSFNQDMLVKFLKFATSQTHTPVGGFQNQECRITITLLNNLQTDIDSRYPEGHTCSREIALPSYSNEEILKKQLVGALTNVGEEFDLI